ncbi:MAG: hypothetical protein WKG07_31100 [Hymenobacter sp.]
MNDLAIKIRIAERDYPMRVAVAGRRAPAPSGPAARRTAARVSGGNTAFRTNRTCWRW